MIKKQGFTLIELIMVIVIITVLAVTVMPRINSISQANIVKEVKILKDTLTLAQEYSMTRGEKYGVCFDTAGNTYSLNKTDCSSAANIVTSPMNRSEPLTVSYSSTLTITPSGTTSIFFNTLGKPSSSSDIQLTFSSGSNSATLTVEQNTGFVHE